MKQKNKIKIELTEEELMYLAEDYDAQIQLYDAMGMPTDKPEEWKLITAIFKKLEVQYKLLKE